MEVNSLERDIEREQERKKESLKIEKEIMEVNSLDRALKKVNNQR